MEPEGIPHDFAPSLVRLDHHDEESNIAVEPAICQKEVDEPVSSNNGIPKPEIPSYRGLRRSQEELTEKQKARGQRVANGIPRPKIPSYRGLRRSQQELTEKQKARGQRVANGIRKPEIPSYPGLRRSQEELTEKQKARGQQKNRGQRVATAEHKDPRGQRKLAKLPHPAARSSGQHPTNQDVPRGQLKLAKLPHPVRPPRQEEHCNLRGLGSSSMEDHLRTAEESVEEVRATLSEADPHHLDDTTQTSRMEQGVALREENAVDNSQLGRAREVFEDSVMDLRQAKGIDPHAAELRRHKRLRVNYHLWCCRSGIVRYYSYFGNVSQE